MLSNGYEGFGPGNMTYLRRAINNEGERYQISLSQVIPDMQLVTLSLHENNPENLAFANLILNSLVPTKATEIYHIISTQSIIPLTIIESDGYQVGLVAKDESSSLSITFDGSKDRKHIKALVIHEQ